MRRVLSLVFILLPAAVFAQSAPIAAITTTPGSSQTIDEIRKAYRLHGGPFYINPGILLKELGVDTNVFNQAGDQQSDFTFTITPKADIAIPFARQALLRMTAATDVVYYQKFESERSLDPQVTARGEVYGNRLTIFAQGAYLNTRERPNYEIDVRSRHLQNDYTAGASVRITTKLSVEVAALRSRTRFDGDAVVLGTRLEQTLNRDENGWGVTARDRLTSLTTVAVRYERQHDRFEFSPERDSDSFRVMPGVEFKPRALVKGSAYVGYRKFTPQSRLLIPEYAGLASQLTLSYTLLGATTFGVTYDRDVDYSYEVGTPYFVDNSPGVYIRRALGGRFDVLVNAARHRYSYRDLGLPNFVAETARVDTTDNFGANLGYRLKQNTRLGFGASYYTRTSTRSAFRDYNGLRAGMTVNYGY
jgi:hypothetical protein